MAANNLALLYHTHHSLEADDLPFWLTWAQQQGGPILELGCGSGRILLPLAEAGYPVFGIDNDRRMLSFFQSRFTEGVCENVTLIRADIRYYCLSARFPLVIFPCNTFSTIEIQQRRLVLNRVRLHLSIDGVFVVSMPNPYLLAGLLPEGENQIETTFPHPPSGDPVQVSSQWQCGLDEVTFIWHYDRLHPDGQVERETLSVRHYLQDLDDFLADFSDAGFKDVSVLGDYDHSEFNPQAPHLIVIARA
jgi:SAM-dependent methyltransferase